MTLVSTTPKVPAPAPSGPSRRTRSTALQTSSALLVTARPRQWLKNVLVLAAPSAAGVMLIPSTAAAALWAGIAFTLAAASTYFVNDARDVEADRLHPVKARRPVAEGVIGRRSAYRGGVVLGALALAAAAPLGWSTTAVIAAYLALTLTYSTWLKNQAVLDILAVAAGFVLRAVAGATATGVQLSNWFLLVALFGSLYLVISKRVAEQAGSVTAATVRPTLGGYPPAWLQQVLVLSLTGTVLSYATWALQYVGADVARPALALSVLPFLAALMRYSLLVARGLGEAPEKVLTSDRFLLVAGAVWAVLVGSALYLT